MCNDNSAPPPDPMIGQAAMQNAQIAKDALAYYKQRDAQQSVRQAKMDDLTTKLADQQMAASQFNDQQARDTWQRYKQTGIPAEDAMYADAANYDTQASRDQAAGQAVDDVAAAQGQARDAQARAMERSGIDPTDGRYLAMQQEGGAQDALARASAANTARKGVKDMGIMLRKDAASFARGMPGSAAQTFGVASAAGGQAAGAVGSAIGAANATAGAMGQGFGIGINGNNSAGSILNDQYGNEVRAAQANQGGLGSALGGLGALGQGLGAMGAVLPFSDKEMKEDRSPVDPDKALEGIEKTPIESWRYKSGTPADDGGRGHIGAMAQDLHKNLGEEVAPGGKRIDPVSAIGVNMAAIKALSKKIDSIAARKGVKA